MERESVTSGGLKFAQGVQEFEKYLATLPNDDANRTLHREAAEAFFNKAHAAGCTEALRAQALLRFDGFDGWSTGRYWKEFKAIQTLMHEYVSEALESDAINPVLAPYFRFLKRTNGSEELFAEGPLSFMLTLDMSSRFHKYLTINTACFLEGSPLISVPQDPSLELHGLQMAQARPNALTAYALYLEAIDPASRLSAEQRADVKDSIFWKGLKFWHPEHFRAYVIDRLPEYIPLGLKAPEHEDTEKLRVSLTSDMVKSIQYICEHGYPVINEFVDPFKILSDNLAWMRKNNKNYKKPKAVAEYLIGRELERKNYTGVLKYPIANAAFTPRVMDRNGPAVAPFWFKRSVETDEDIISMVASASDIERWRSAKLSDSLSFKI